MNLSNLRQQSLTQNTISSQGLLVSGAPRPAAVSNASANKAAPLPPPKKITKPIPPRPVKPSGMQIPPKITANSVPIQLNNNNNNNNTANLSKSTRTPSPEKKPLSPIKDQQINTPPTEQSPKPIIKHTPTNFNNQQISQTESNDPIDLDEKDTDKVNSIQQQLAEQPPVFEDIEDAAFTDCHQDALLEPKIEEALFHTRITLGRPLKLTCICSGNPAPKAFWFKEGRQISKKSKHFITRVSVEQNDLSLKVMKYILYVHQTCGQDDGIYSCVIISPAGLAISSAKIIIEKTNNNNNNNNNILANASQTSLGQNISNQASQPLSVLSKQESNNETFEKEPQNLNPIELDKLAITSASELMSEEYDLQDNKIQSPSNLANANSIGKKQISFNLPDNKSSLNNGKISFSTIDETPDTSLSPSRNVSGSAGAGANANSGAAADHQNQLNIVDEMPEITHQRALSGSSLDPTSRHVSGSMAKDPVPTPTLTTKLLGIPEPTNNKM